MGKLFKIITLSFILATLNPSNLCTCEIEEDICVVEECKCTLHHQSIIFFGGDYLWQE